MSHPDIQTQKETLGRNRQTRRTAHARRTDLNCTPDHRHDLRLGKDKKVIVVVSWLWRNAQAQFH
jgi:hypothetical protein